MLTDLLEGEHLEIRVHTWDEMIVDSSQSRFVWVSYTAAVVAVAGTLTLIESSDSKMSKARSPP